jgi:hypothetical protein
MTDHVADDEILAMRDIADGLLESSDGQPLGRVADVEIALGDEGIPRLAALLVGPEALAGRVATRLRRPVAWLLRGRFEHRIAIEEVERFGPTVNLRQAADAYEHGSADDWVMRHLLRFIPGNGASQ